jgi:hypothetical protein
MNNVGVQVLIKKAELLLPLVFILALPMGMIVGGITERH